MMATSPTEDSPSERDAKALRLAIEAAEMNARHARLFKLIALVLVIINLGVGGLVSVTAANNERIEKAACLEILFLRETSEPDTDRRGRILQLADQLDRVVDCDHDGIQAN